MATTKYRVLRKTVTRVDDAVMDGGTQVGVAGPSEASEVVAVWEILHLDVVAGSGEQAIRLVLADMPGATGTFAAVPQRNWSEITFRREPQPDRLVVT